MARGLKLLRNWWVVRCAEAAMRDYVAHSGVYDKVAIQRDVRQSLRNIGWDDARIDPWIAARRR